MQSHVVTMRETKQCSLKAMPEAIAWEGMLMWTPFNHDTSKKDPMVSGMHIFHLPKDLLVCSFHFHDKKSIDKNNAHEHICFVSNIS